ncbi:hypothetical protein ACLB2K_007884 [Fragaria x ananassa]
MELHTPNPDVPEALTRDPTGMKARRHAVIVRLISMDNVRVGLVHEEAEALFEAINKRWKRGRHVGNKNKLPYWEKKALLEDATKKQSTRRNLIWRV